MSNLYLVATPIGNLDDITLRALETLRQVSWIAAEDTRHTGRLLKHYNIETSLISFHEHSQPAKLEHLVSLLEQADVALVSDAGTPVISDPGYELVIAALAAGHQVIPIPGPSAPITALIASGLPSDRFLYLGYLPRKSSERRQLLEGVLDMPYTLIFFETPHRLLASLQDLLDVLGDRDAAVGREITKLHEEFFRGTVSHVLAHFNATPPRGEITLVVAGRSKYAPGWTEEQLIAAIKDLQTQALPPAQIASQLAAQSHWPRRKIYQIIINMD